MVYKMGTRTSAVEPSRPPTTTMASGWEMNPSLPSAPKVVGIMTQTAAGKAGATRLLYPVAARAQLWPK